MRQKCSQMKGYNHTHWDLVFRAYPGHHGNLLGALRCNNSYRSLRTVRRRHLRIGVQFDIISVRSHRVWPKCIRYGFDTLMAVEV